jgi:biopolymer transport protein TolQ
MDISILDLVLNASVIVQSVMVVLVLLSLLSWACIFNKLIVFRSAKKYDLRFTKHFSNDSIEHTQQIDSIDSGDMITGPLERVYQYTMQEYQKFKPHKSLDSDKILNSLYRSMRNTIQRELDAAEFGMSFLATVGSVSPYIGLFGTVWGIMHAFTGLSMVDTVSLETVAPGIAEALIATALGLFAAIPAVIAYNHFSRSIEYMESSLESFIEDLYMMLQRNSVATLATN